jgi:hypothetical protein
MNHHPFSCASPRRLAMPPRTDFDLRTLVTLYFAAWRKDLIEWFETHQKGVRFRFQGHLLDLEMPVAMVFVQRLLFVDESLTALGRSDRYNTLTTFPPN